MEAASFDRLDMSGAQENDDPVRTCAGCRQRDAQDALLRFVHVEGTLVPDPRRRLPGRGVSAHPTRKCIERAVERGGFARGLGHKVEANATELCRTAAVQYERRAEGLLLAARRSRALALGTESVKRALDAGTVALLVVAKDAAGRRAELEGRAARAVSMSTKEHLGRLMGRAEISVMAILDVGIAEEVAATAARATQLEAAE
jgi:predicted RNA-binding protein YlxR (DUF448 family)/ribosomal protein L30E